MDIGQIIQVSFLAVPFFITILTETLKQIPQVPVDSKNAKYVALGFALLAVVAMNWTNFSWDNSLLYAGQIVANYGLAVGFYETIKKFFKKL